MEYILNLKIESDNDYQKGHMLWNLKSGMFGIYFSEDKFIGGKLILDGNNLKDSFYKNNNEINNLEGHILENQNTKLIVITSKNLSIDGAINEKTKEVLINLYLNNKKYNISGKLD